MADSRRKGTSGRTCRGVLIPYQTPEGGNRGGPSIITRVCQAPTAQSTKSSDPTFAEKISHITIIIRNRDEMPEVTYVRLPNLRTASSLFTLLCCNSMVTQGAPHAEIRSLTSTNAITSLRLTCFTALEPSI